MLLGAAAILWLTGVRHTGLYPVVLSDEYRYSAAARLMPFADSSVPNYLFLAVYRLTNVCGDDFLNCARWLNVAFFGAANVFVYLTARLFMGRTTALVVALLALVSPLSTYTAYFMPESMYCFGFWGSTWLILSLRFDRKPGEPSLRYAAVGCVLGLLALVKPHALFLVPPVACYCAFAEWRVRRPSAASLASKLLALVLSCLAVKFGIGAAVAGRSGLTLFGSFYADVLPTATASGIDVWFAGMASGAVDNLSGHVMALVLLFAMPVAALLSSSLDLQAAGRRPWRLPLFTVSTLCMLVVTSTAFTVAVAGQGPYETIDRLHGRYYDFVFPLLIMVGATYVETSYPRRALRLMVALPLALVVLYVGVTGLQRFDITVTDNPVLCGITEHTAVRSVAALLGLVSLALWSVRPKVGALWFLLAVMPFVAVKGTAVIGGQLDGRRTPDLYDAAGIAAKRALAGRGATHVQVFGDDPAGVFRTLFQIDDAAATATVLDRDAKIDDKRWAEPSDWAVVIGDHPSDVEADRVDREGFVLLHRRPAAR